jgi:hypothetical protein
MALKRKWKKKFMLLVLIINQDKYSGGIKCKHVEET